MPKASSRVAPEEQGLLQSGLAGINNFANVVAPLLTAGLFAYAVSRGTSFALVGAPLFLCAALELAALFVARRAFRRPLGPVQREEARAAASS